MSKLNIPENFRLGYACINTELRKKNIFSSRTCRLATLESKGIEYVKNLALKNLKDLQTILELILEMKEDGQETQYKIGPGPIGYKII